jgi:hypothetical protein
MYAWVIEAFGTREFDIDQFRASFPSPSPKKVLSDMNRLGYLERVRRGRYKLVAPQDVFKRVVSADLSELATAKEAGLPFAYADSTAVTIWTEGQYWTGFTKGFRPVHIKILAGDADAWRRFFRRRGMRSASPGERRTLFGVTHILHASDEVAAVDVGGDPVVPLEEVLEFCRRREATFRPAMEHLDRRYGLGLFEEYEHAEAD